jgi:hypothetical protein
VIFREYIVDLMADPGTLIPSDAAGSHIEYEESINSASPLSRDIDSSHMASSSSGVGSSFEEHSDFGTLDKRPRFSNLAALGKECDDRSDFTSANITRPTKSDEEHNSSLDDFRTPSNVEKVPVRELPGRPNYPYMHTRSPSWTEGISSPAVRKMKVKDVSQYMIDAAKENPQLAQKLHDVLLESGVVAPANLFSEIYSEQFDVSALEARSSTEDKDENKHGIGIQEIKGQDDADPPRILPPLPPHRVHSKARISSGQEHLKSVEGLGINLPLDTAEVTRQPISSQLEATPVKYTKNVPVAAAAAAAAAVVASSMVVAVAKSSSDSNFELPVAAAATATAAAVVATTAAVSKQYEQSVKSDGDADGAGYEPRGSGDRQHDASGAILEGERISDRSAGNDCTKSDVTLDEVAELEIQWEEITLGDRIGLGIYHCAI